MYDKYPILVHQWLEKTASEFPDKTALVCGKESITYRELNEKSDNMAAALRLNGISHQDRVVIFLENSIETVISLYAVAKAGAIFVIVNEQLKAAKLAYIINNSQAKFLVSSGPKIKTVSLAVNECHGKPKLIFTRINKKVTDQFNDSLAFEELTSSKPDTAGISTVVEIIDQDLAALIYTSGSTGEPKGVMSSHLNMISAARSIIQYTKQCSGDIILNVLPLSFDYGLYQVIMSVMFGGTVILEKSFAYFHQVLLKISEYKVTGFPIVPTIVAMMLNLQDLSKYDFSSLRFITNTGAALPVEHIRRFRKLFPRLEIYSMYGLTECKRVSYLPVEQIDIRPDSVGIAMPNCRVLIVDNDGKPVNTGEIGELIIQGSNVMPGYWQDPQLSAKVYKTGYLNLRYLYSGDFFKQDKDGYLYFLGRKDDMIKTRGERVSPKEIENIISQYPGVAEVAVIGIPEPIMSQVPKAFIVKANGYNLNTDDILKYSIENMERFMVPGAVEFIDALPKTPNGKIDKNKLKEQELQI